MAQHLRLSRQNQERVGASRHVLCIQISRCLPMQGTPKTEKETDGKSSLYFLIYFCLKKDDQPFRVCLAKILQTK